MEVIKVEKRLLTNVVADLVNKKARTLEYGVSILNLPDFDYAKFATMIDASKKSEMFFLGFNEIILMRLRQELPDLKNITYMFTAEEAENSRNSGDESVFRILIIKQTEVAKLSSLRWFPEIDLEMVYNQSCSYAKKQLSETANTVIEALIQALGRKSIRNILSFERVLEYLETLLAADTAELPKVVRDGFYKLGLCRDSELDAKAPSVDDFVKKIRHNHSIVERIGNLEQAERQGITNYYANNENNSETPRLILQYYKTRNVNLLKHMELTEVEKCLKTVKKRTSLPPQSKTKNVSPTALATQLIFDDNPEQIDNVLAQVTEAVDQRNSLGKSEHIQINIDGAKLQIKTEPATEIIADDLTDEEDYGGIIIADVLTPSEAILDIDKYNYTKFTDEKLNWVRDKLSKIATLVPDGEQISSALQAFVKARSAISPFRKRLQDVPMLQVISQKDAFAKYIDAYERLLTVINDDFPKIWKLAPSSAKTIINIIISLDNIYILGAEECHVIPTPLNPLYLWKYVKLAEEILSNKGVASIEECHLSEEDKSFIARKADDIPDPLTITLLPVTVREEGAVFIPIAGRIGTLPIYSTKQQINQSESGIDALKQAIIRYLCLYPHAGMMLRLVIIDPPSVEIVVSMLKMLNNDKEFNIFGIDVSIYRTKEAVADWVEIQDDSLNDGMLGQIKGRRSLKFRLRIVNKKMEYAKILENIKEEQHILIMFDPNEIKVTTTQNDKRIHIHPLCVPKIYQYNPVEETVEIRPANEGGIFTYYSSILEKLNEHPSSFSHTSTFFNTPLKRSTYDKMLSKADWLVILDQSLKNWDISLRAASEKLFYRENDYRSVGIYSRNSKKIILGYNSLIKQLGNYAPQTAGVENIIQAVRETNDDGLLSIVSHTSNKIFDDKHGKGSLGLAIAAIRYKRYYPDAILVGLDTKLAREWLSEREDGRLPDLIGIRLESDSDATIDIFEVKTYADNSNAFEVDDFSITGHAVEQVTVLEELIREIFGNSEKVTTISRREILREQVFECLFESNMNPSKKHQYSEGLNNLFSGNYHISVNKSITYVDFDNSASSIDDYSGIDQYAGNTYTLITIGSTEIQSIISGSEYSLYVNINNESRSKTTAQADNNSSDLTTDEAAQQNTESEAEQDAKRDIEEKCARLNKVFRDYGIKAYAVSPDRVLEAARFTRFEVELKSGESFSNIDKHKIDIGIQLEANGEILAGHIKGTKYISVDIPFSGCAKTISLLKNLDLLKEHKGNLNIIAGQKPDGKFEVLDLSKAPHLLVAGTTGSGKTIFLYSIIISLIHQFTADELELLIIDPKQTDFTFFEGLPHLYGGHVVTEATEALKMIESINSNDKETRTAMLKTSRSRDIESYNEKNPEAKMKRLVVVIDEYADLIQAAEIQGSRKKFEDLLVMLAQRVRNLGIHLVIATQRPTAKIVTGTLKANIPYRVSFRLPSHQDSLTILDETGAENLLGKGDMIMKTDNATMRMQGLFITEDELEDYIETLGE